MAYGLYIYVVRLILVEDVAKYHNQWVALSQ